MAVDTREYPLGAGDGEPDQWNSDEPIIRQALSAMGLSVPSPLPKPGYAATGVAGRSRVWFISLDTPTKGELSMIAKLDDPARASKEWEAIKNLEQLNTPLEAILPMRGNHREHGVVIYQNSAAQASTGRIWTLRELLHKQLSHNPGNCTLALDKVLDALRLFYQAEPGSARLASAGGGTLWKDSFPALNHQLDGLQAAYEKPGEWRGEHSLPNPFTEAKRYLSEPRGKILCSRIHGDPNLTNFLIGLNGKYEPERVFIIDLADSRHDMPVALDLARMEAEFWHEVFAGENDENGQPPNPAERLKAFQTWRARLDGRRGETTESGFASAGNAVSWVNRIRDEASRVLAAGQATYAMHDYMVALYLTHLNSLHYASVRQSPLKVQVALAGAASALAYLLELEHGKKPSMPVLSADGLIYAPDETKSAKAKPHTGVGPVANADARGRDQDQVHTDNSSTDTNTPILPTAIEKDLARLLETCWSDKDFSTFVGHYKPGQDRETFFNDLCSSTNAHEELVKFRLALKKTGTPKNGFSLDASNAIALSALVLYQRYWTARQVSADNISATNLLLAAVQGMDKHGVDIAVKGDDAAYYQTSSSALLPGPFLEYHKDSATDPAWEEIKLSLNLSAEALISSIQDLSLRNMRAQFEVRKSVLKKGDLAITDDELRTKLRIVEKELGTPFVYFVDHGDSTNLARIHQERIAQEFGVKTIVWEQKAGHDNDASQQIGKIFEHLFESTLTSGAPSSAANGEDLSNCQSNTTSTADTRNSSNSTPEATKKTAQPSGEQL